VNANELLSEIESDVAASAGAACHAGEVRISHVLRAMAIPEEWARGTLRFSTGRYTTSQEVNEAAAVIASAVRKLRKR
jgi:cysteine desulfurase